LTDQLPVVVAQKLSYAAPNGGLLVRDLSFAVNRGEIVAIIGPNGVGKSTLLRVLQNEIQPASGTVKVSAPKISYLSQLHNREFHIPLTLADVLSFGIQSAFEPSHAIEYGLLTINELKKPWNTASGGERQKTLLTQALLADGDLFIFDEPMNHLDSLSRHTLMQIFSNLAIHKNRAVIFVSHERTLTTPTGENLAAVRTIDLARYTPSC
jgi:ABC-type Mn2+/Zn2+ transport system ATPase subunit